MKGIILVGLFSVGLVAIFKHHQAATGGGTTGTAIPSGVSVYPSTPAPNLPQQVTAAFLTNPDAVSLEGYSAATGANENQPTDDELLW
jgi:hypothetical protein